VQPFFKLNWRVSDMDVVFQGHKLAAIVSEFRTGRTWARIMGGKHFPHVVDTRRQAALRVRIDGNLWGLSVSELPPGE